jgi:hypothetical protein
MAPPDPPPLPGPWRSNSLEWGIGSIVLGLIVIVLVPSGLLMAAVGLTVVNVQWTDENFNNASLAATVALVVCTILALGSLFSALMGFIQGLALRLPRGLCVSGFILGVAALGAVIFAVNVVIAAKDDIRRFKEAPRITTALPQNLNQNDAREPAGAISRATDAPDVFPGYAVGPRAVPSPDPELKSYFPTPFGRSERETA